jgi:restriction system protein
VRNYYRVFLGSGSIHTETCVENGFIGVNYGFKESLSPYLAETNFESRQKMKPVYFTYNPDQSPVGAGLSCSVLWTVAQGMQRGDVVICPDGKGNYFSAEISGEYRYESNSELPHQRPVIWRPLTFARAAMTEVLKRATAATLTVIDVAPFEDLSAFRLEEHLEDFLVKNWAQTDLSKKYDLVTDQKGVVIARQYPCDKGKIDILALSKDKKEFLVVELKKGRGSDEAVGQILRYMGFVKNDLATNGENVRGIIIALDDDPKLNYALSMVPIIDFYRYKVDFELIGK